MCSLISFGCQPPALPPPTALLRCDGFPTSPHPRAPAAPSALLAATLRLTPIPFLPPRCLWSLSWLSLTTILRFMSSPCCSSNTPFPFSPPPSLTGRCLHSGVWAKQTGPHCPAPFQREPSVFSDTSTSLALQKCAWLNVANLWPG